MKLKNKVVIITGSTSGMGKKAVEVFSKQGAKVVITGRSEKEGKKIAKKTKNAIYVKLDVTDEGSVKGMVKQVIDKWGRIDVLYNNAGIEFQKPLIKMTKEEWDKILNVNLRGMFLCMKHCIPKMKKGGSVINVSSVAGLVGNPMLTAYSASKGGIIALTKSAAIELASKGIRVNSIAPGPIDTPMIKRYIKDSPDPEKTKNQLTSKVPLRRMGKPEEVAKTALFLASDESSYITGVVIPVDGGSVTM